MVPSISKVLIEGTISLQPHLHLLVVKYMMGHFLRTEEGFWMRDETSSRSRSPK